MDLTSKLLSFGRKARLEAERAIDQVAPKVRDAAAQAPEAAEHAVQAAVRAGRGAAQAAQEAAAAAVPGVRKTVERAAPAVKEAVEKAAPAVADAAIEAAQSAAFAALKGKRPASVVMSAATNAAKSAAGRVGKTAAKTVAEVAVKNAADMREADARAHTVHNDRTGQDVVVEAYVKGPNGARDYARVYPKGAKDDFGPVGNKAVGALLIMAGLPMLVLPGPGAAAIAAGMYYLRKAAPDDVVHVDVEVGQAERGEPGSHDGQTGPQARASQETNQKKED